ncbi:ATP-binding protein [Euzebya sp.]|uniref:ATP-binding protein n=1 Tax=Euzebya sp. TaxID=1971409 RepID=UPI0035191D70
MLRVDGAVEERDPVVLHAPDHGADARATAVLTVLGGVSARTVADRYDIPVSLLDRWVSDFLAAGRSAMADEHPEGDARARHDRYLSLVAHELRSPLAMLQGWADLLGADPEDRDVVAHAVSGIGSNVARLRRLVDDALDAASVAQGRLDLRLVTTPLAPIVRQVLGARADHVPDLVVDDDVVVRIDPDRIGQVLDNLIDNARKHGDGVTAVHVGRAGDDAEISVHSPGQGIDEDVASRMFEPFERGSSATDGVGLGLFVCRSLVTAHGGRIGVRSDLAGNRFWVRLPVAG